ncbi:MAG: PilZ domain-containing protein [Polyangiales bacterium]
MSSWKTKQPGSPPTSKESAVRPTARENERRRAERRPSDAEVEILAPIQQTASALDVSKTGMQVSLGDWLSAGTVCDLRIKTHTGREFLQRARVVWTRREGSGCVCGLEFVGSSA